MAKRTPNPSSAPYYSLFRPPLLSQTELVKTTLDHDSTDLLIDKWLEHRQDAYHDWFRDVRERKRERENNNTKGGNGNGNVRNTNTTANGTSANTTNQILVWNKGEFVPENIFCRTVDTGRLIPLDRTWTTHVYSHRSIQERKRPMMPVVFTMLPELMLLRGMHDLGCDEIFIIVTDLQRQEMDDVSEYFKLVCRSGHAFRDGQGVKPSLERRIRGEHMRITHALHRHRRTPCFPQIDLTLRAILYEKNPRFVILFSPQPTSYSQILFTHESYVPAEEVFYDYPTGCPNPCCVDNCEMIRFPRGGAASACVLDVEGAGGTGRIPKEDAANKTKRSNNKLPFPKSKGGNGFGRRVRVRNMCNWIECDVCFWEEVPSRSRTKRERDSDSEETTATGSSSNASSEGSTEGTSDGSLKSTTLDRRKTSLASPTRYPSQTPTPISTRTQTQSAPSAKATPSRTIPGQLCSKCRLVKYCSLEHQRKDWEEHRKVCVRME